jgi:hypothetical protein
MTAIAVTLLTVTAAGTVSCAHIQMHFDRMPSSCRAVQDSKVTVSIDVPASIYTSSQQSSIQCPADDQLRPACAPLCLLLLLGCAVQLDWFELYLRAQEERGYDGSFNMFMQLQVRSTPVSVCCIASGVKGHVRTRQHMSPMCTNRLSWDSKTYHNFSILVS